jgi:soluble lytic murein transglycosylase
VLRRLAALLAVLVMACDATGRADGDVAAQTPSGLARAIGQTGDLAKAEAAIEAGHPWRATQIVAPILRDPQQKTPAAILVAARAAAGWGGWAEVDKLLATSTWVDTAFDADGRELLARAALERDLDTVAMRHVSALMKDPGPAETKATRSVLFARALERNNHFDGAATAYASAADQLTSVRDWLLLRAAGTQSDSTQREVAYARVTLAPSRARVPWTEAQARERFRDALGAAARFAKLGAAAQSFRLRLSVAPDSGTREAVKAEALAYIRDHPGTAESKSAIDVLDRAFTLLSPQEQLVIARSASVNGPPARAVAAYDRAASAGLELTSDDRYRYGQALARVNRSRDAIKELGLVEGALAGQAAYQASRTIMSSSGGAAARTALRDVWTRFPADTAASSAAMSLYADLATDDGDDADARATYLQLSRAYPTSARAPEARLQAALIAITTGQNAQATRELDSLAARYPRSEVGAAARYWSARAWKSAGDEQRATEQWRGLLTQQPMSYYTVLAANRLGDRVPSPAQPGAGSSSHRSTPVDSAIARIKLLQRLGMDVEARFEMDALEERANASAERALATADAFLAIDQSSRAIRIAQKLAESGRRDERVMRIVYPVVDRDELIRTAKARDLDPALVAAIVRQESSFNPRAVSAADARGLMQVLPSVGQDVARSVGFPVWYPALLLDPDANLQLGTAHLATYRRQYGPLPRVLAAYNAGGSRVERWSGRKGADDPEMFTERIPFVETRDYVRVVQRNLAVYRALYDWR